MAQPGRVNGTNLHTSLHWGAGDANLYRSYAAELIGLRPDVILSTNTPMTAIFKKMSASIPIVFVTLADPVGSGLISNLARSEANLTGFIDFEYSLAGKWVQLLKAIDTKLKRIVVMFNQQPLLAEDHYF
jgi:putative tryptophan/tyrosine transport system substrate-binding protein